jgi:uncharacterized alkaline shock family protein YloU
MRPSVYALRVYHERTRFGKHFRKKRERMPRTSAIPLQNGTRPLGKIEVLPNAVHTIAVQAISECYGVVGIAAPRLHYGHPVILRPEHQNQGVQMRVLNDRIVLDVYVVVEYGLRISEIGHNIMSSVRFSIEKMLGVKVVQVNVNVQGLSHSTVQASAPESKNAR